MRLDNKSQKVRGKFLIGLSIIGVLSIMFFLLLTVAFTTNRLFVNNIGSVIASKFERVLIGNKNYAVSSVSDLKVHLSGAINGILNPVDLPQLQLSLKQDNLLKLMSAKERQEKKWVNAGLKAPDVKSELKAKIRLKGDRELHSENINNLSFRINLRGEDRLFGLEEFSIQRPLLRGYTWELLISKVFEQQQLMTLKSHPIEFKVNGDNRGIYVVEEVPNTRTVERNKRKDGPIFGLEEKNGVTSISSKLDVYDIKKWNGTSLYKYSKKVLNEQFLRASQGESFSSEHFDVDEWARYFALHDIFSSYHGTVPKSVKFYFNPVVGKFQPLLFDAHVGAGRFSNFILLDFLLGNPACEWICADQKYYMAFLRNSQFVEAYIRYLEQYSTSGFVDSVVSTYKSSYQPLDHRLYASFAASDKIFYRGFSLWLFKTDILHKRAELISEKLSIFLDKTTSIHSWINDGNLMENNSNVNSSISTPPDIKIINSQNLKLKANVIEFTEPTLWLLEGENTLSGLDANALIQLKGPVMLVQLNGSLTVNNLEISGGKEHNILNRNWSGVLNIVNSTFKANNIRITHSDAEDALNLVSTEFEIGTVYVKNSRSDAIDFDFSSGKIEKITCLKIGNDCLDGSESTVRVIEAYADNVRDKVISAGENSTIAVDELSAHASAIALVSKDGASLSVNNINLVDIDLFAAVFNKKPEYGRPKLQVQNVSSEEALLALQSKDSDLRIKDTRTLIERRTSAEIEGAMYGVTYGVATQK